MKLLDTEVGGYGKAPSSLAPPESGKRFQEHAADKRAMWKAWITRGPLCVMGRFDDPADGVVLLDAGASSAP